jgi:hypothetical protein
MLGLDGAAYFYMMATVTFGEVCATYYIEVCRLVAILDVAVKTSMLRT